MRVSPDLPNTSGSGEESAVPLEPVLPHQRLKCSLITGIPAEEQRIVFAGHELTEDECLSLAGVRDEATLQVLGRLLGGAKKRKKKTYTKPKKIKHKHKKVKLRILKFYKVLAWLWRGLAPCRAQHGIWNGIFPSLLLCCHQNAASSRK